MSDNDLTVCGYTDGDIDTNRSDNPTLQSMIEQRYSRRQALFGGASVMTAAVFGLAACSDNEDVVGAVTVQAGANATTSSGKVVTLTGTANASSGALSGSGWTQTSGPQVTLTDATATSARFLAPSWPAPEG